MEEQKQAKQSVDEHPQQLSSNAQDSKTHSRWIQWLRSLRPLWLGLSLTMRRVLTVVAAVVALFVLFMLFKPTLPNLNPFKHHEVEIDDTEMLLVEIREINELTTAGFFDEMVMHYTKEGTRLLTSAPDEIVIVVKGKVRAGFDLSGIDSTRVRCHGDSVWVVLPEPEVFDVLVNPSDIRIFAQDGKWSHQQVTKIEKEASKRLRQRAIDSGILDKASRAGVSHISEMLHSLGYTEVYISVQKSVPVVPTELRTGTVLSK